MKLDKLIGFKVLVGRDNIVSLDEIGCQIKVLVTIEDNENKSKIADFVATAINEKLSREINLEHPRRTIEELKVLHEAPNSETLFDFVTPPEHVCTYAHQVRTKIETGLKDKISGEEIEYLLYSIERLRKRCEDIRRWGSQWKHLAKKVIDDRDGCADLLASKYKRK